MAIIKTIPIHGETDLQHVQDYIENPNKTTLEDASISQGINQELMYGENPAKTTVRNSEGYSESLVDGYQCSVLSAVGDFALARHRYESGHAPRNYKSKKPVIAIHMIQSFDHNESLDPRLVHQIGMELVKSLKDAGIGDFQAVVSTHMNTDHLHNHILLNAFSVDGRQKYKDNQTTRNLVRQLSDEICIRYGLDVLPEQSRNKHKRNPDIGEQKARLDGRSWKDKIRRDIDKCILASCTPQDWISRMNEIGYSFRNKKDGTPISVSDGTHHVRLSTLGQDYTYESVLSRISEDIPLINMDEIRRRHQKEITTSLPYYPEYFQSVRRFNEYGHRRSDLEIIILSLIRYLRRLLARLRKAFEQHAQEEIGKAINLTQRQIKDLEKTLNLIGQYHIAQPSDIEALMKATGKQLSLFRKDANVLQHSIASLEQFLHSSILLNTETFSQNPDEDIPGDSKTSSEPPASISEEGSTEAHSSSQNTESDIPDYLSTLSPMTPEQRRNLFLLSRESGWRIYTKFDFITAREAENAIRFLKEIMADPAKASAAADQYPYNGSRKTYIESIHKSSYVGFRIPSLFFRDFVPTVAGETNINEELVFVRDRLRKCERNIEESSKQYKDLVFLKKTCQTASHDYHRLHNANPSVEPESPSRPVNNPDPATSRNDAGRRNRDQSFDR